MTAAAWEPVYVRAAVPGDVDQLLELRVQVMAGEPVTQAWRDTLGQDLRERLGVDPDLLVFVAPGDGGQLLACAIGMAYHGYRSPRFETGRWGRVLIVVTRPAARRRGYAKAVMRALLDAFDAAGCSASIELRATDMAEPLYTGLGFTQVPSGSYMTLRPTPDRPPNQGGSP
ncbi:GNAT family N-acetyltransferase [Streptacidiphilus fuscans]|uniref:GNAT family N-acetyltransferase n=1 Tax=Streptacidiphilus fuscans TaxID=2789292 RepID=A0A931B604_9ACTN|nr:GNAT family N-acetyltransferase [Streptacidiphilus fuscans]MBF9071860.1 GNAT family N-acetyltransferase [Streptacidiphilus fuscans]